MIQLSDSQLDTLADVYTRLIQLARARRQQKTGGVAVSESSTQPQPAPAVPEKKQTEGAR